MDLHDICHVEIRTRDLTRAKDFYGFVFDWKFQDAMDGYILIDTGTQPGGGLARASGPLGVTSYVLVADCNASTRRVAELGGRVVAPTSEVPGFGKYAIVADPWHNELGLWRPASSEAPKPKGSGENNFCWLELFTPLPAAAIDYYEKLFGWTFDFDPGHYANYAHTEFEGKDFGIGLTADSAGTLAYIYTENLAATSVTIAGRGGHIVGNPREIENVGFAATFLDSEGNRLALLSENPYD